jgi:hypothetical protein
MRGDAPRSECAGTTGPARWDTRIMPLRSRVTLALLTSALAACTASAPDRGDDFGGSDDAAGEPCTPGEQRACACPGGAPDGAQICADSGDRFGACFGCDEETDGGDASSSEGDDASTIPDDDGIDDGASATMTTEATTSGDVPDDGIPDNPPQAVPPAPPPDGFAVVQQVANEHPDWLIGSCVDQGGNNEFLFEVVRRLRMQDDRWGLNWKRGVVGDMSQDVVDYHYGEGLSEESTDVYIIDMIGGHCPEDGSSPQAAWIDVTQATLDGGTVGMWTLAGQDL